MGKKRVKSKGQSKARRLAGRLGVVRISHRRPVDEAAVATDLSQIGPRLGRSRPAARTDAAKKPPAK